MRLVRARAIGIAIAVALAVLFSVLAGCGSGNSPSGSTPATTPTSASPSAAYSGAPISEAEAQAVRDRALGYWAAYNAYDADKAIAYLADTIKPVKAEVIRSEVGRIKTFGVQLGVSQKTPPELIGQDQAQMYLKMKTPTGMRTVLMKFSKQGELWMVTYSEEVN
jgi:hypothetical protein